MEKRRGKNMSFEINGKYGTAKVFTDLVDETSISQVMGLLNHRTFLRRQVQP